MLEGVLREFTWTHPRSQQEKRGRASSERHKYRLYPGILSSLMTIWSKSIDNPDVIDPFLLAAMLAVSSEVIVYNCRSRVASLAHVACLHGDEIVVDVSGENYSRVFFKLFSVF